MHKIVHLLTTNTIQLNSRDIPTMSNASMVPSNPRDATAEQIWDHTRLGMLSLSKYGTIQAQGCYHLANTVP